MRQRGAKVSSGAPATLSQAGPGGKGRPVRLMLTSALPWPQDADSERRGGGVAGGHTAPGQPLLTVGVYESAKLMNV